jgi:hypothetical protein
MFGSINSTPHGVWLHYPWRGLKVAVHSAAPGKSSVTVLWKGAPQIVDLGLFFENAAAQMKASPPYNGLTVSAAGTLPFKFEHASGIAPNLPTDANFIRFESAIQSEGGEPPLIVWANFDPEVSPDQESVGVYLREQDLSVVQNEVSGIVVKTTAPQLQPAPTSSLEAEIKEILAHIGSDLQEASKIATP